MACRQPSDTGKNPREARNCRSDVKQTPQKGNYAPDRRNFPVRPAISGLHKPLIAGLRMAALRLPCRGARRFWHRIVQHVLSAATHVDGTSQFNRKRGFTK